MKRFKEKFKPIQTSGKKPEENDNLMKKIEGRFLLKIQSESAREEDKEIIIVW